MVQLTYTFAILSLSLLTVASPWGDPPPTTVTVTVTAPGAPAPSGGSGSGGVSQCNTGNTYCCNSLQQGAGGLLGIGNLLGLGCSAISILNIIEGECDSHPACCTGNVAAGGLINIGCLPIIL